MTGLSDSEVKKIVNRYIGVFDGYLSNFTYRSLSNFYPEYCDLDIDTDQYEGTMRYRFISILQSSPPSVQAKIVRGALQKFPLDSEDKKPSTRTKELYDELLTIIQRLETCSTTTTIEQSIDGDEKTEVYISYAWNGESENFVNQLDKVFQAKGIDIKRDKRELHFKESIKAFMEKIGRGNAVIIIISEKYLKSDNCMFELMEIVRNGDFHDRVFPIVLDDANIYSPVPRLRYIKYWEEKTRELDEEMKSVSAAIDLYTSIRATISSLTNTLKNMNTLPSSIHIESDFEALLQALKPHLAKAGKHKLNERQQDFELLNSTPPGSQSFLIPIDDSDELQKELSDELKAEKSASIILDRNISQLVDEAQATLDPKLQAALAWLSDSDYAERVSTCGNDALKSYPDIHTEFLSDLRKFNRFKEELKICFYRLHFAILTDNTRPINETKISFNVELYQAALEIVLNRVPTDSQAVKQRFQQYVQYFRDRLYPS
jgi:hypothetical protein